MISRQMSVDLPSGTVTFLFTDVEGSTKLLHSLGAEGYAEALAEHRRLIREACARHDGVEVDTQGDAFFFAFPTAPGAVAAAGEMTDALASGPIRVRIGLHTGTPLLTEEGYVGDDVHFAARVAASSHGGQVVFSAATAELVELSLTDLGEHRLKDIEGPVSIFQLGDGRFPPLKTISNTNLPRPASSFVGREAELAEVLARIEGGARLVTLTGPGGTGKTRLALEAAASIVPEYKAGVFWVGLASLRDPALVTETISQTLGAKDGLAEHISEREMLLLLDNLEQVIEAAPELASLVTACPNLTLLVTSRELLRVQGEVEYAVPPLAETEAVSLFCERSGLDSSEEVAELCARLDSLPLAVELAAARTKALSPAQILERLSQRLDLLKGGRDADPRQQTLRATIEWSYELLSEEEQRLFRALSVFAGGCTLGAAEEVADADLDTLQSLVEKSLLRFSNERYGVLETIREYAGERLDETGEREVLHRRHADWFLALAHTDDSSRTRAQDRIATLRVELDNFRAALEWLRAGENGELRLELVISLFELWIVGGYATEGQRTAQDALTGAEGYPGRLRAKAAKAAGDLALDHGDYAAANELLEQALDLYRGLGDRWGVASCLTDLGHVAKCVRDDRRADDLFRASIELARDLEDRNVLATALLNYGDFLVSSGKFVQAEFACRESLTLHREVGDPLGAAACLFSLGLACLHQDRSQEALDLFRECLAVHLEFEYAVGIACSLEGIAAMAAAGGRMEDAARLLGAAKALLETAGTSLEPAERELHERTIAILRTGIGDESLARLIADGRTMSLEDSAQLALAP